MSYGTPTPEQEIARLSKTMSTEEKIEYFANPPDSHVANVLKPLWITSYLTTAGKELLAKAEARYALAKQKNDRVDALSPQEKIAKLTTYYNELPPGFFDTYSMSRLENVLAGVSLPIAINGLIGNVVAQSIKVPTQPCVNNALALIDPYLPNASKLLHSATSVSYANWSMTCMPAPHSQSSKVLDLTIACIGMAQKQGSGIVKLSVPYNWYTYTMKIPRADGSVVTVPMIIGYKLANGYYWDNVKCFVVCTPPASFVVAPKGWTTFPNMFEVTNIVWPIHKEADVPDPYRFIKQPTLKFVIANVLIQNDKTNPGALQKLVAFAKASTFASSNIVDGSLSNALQLQMTGGSVKNYKDNKPSRVPFTNPCKELLWGIGNACIPNSLQRQAQAGDPDCYTAVILLFDEFRSSDAYKTLSPATNNTPGPVPVPVPASGGTKRRSSSSHKKRSYKTRSYKPRSYKTRSYKTCSYKKRSDKRN